MDMEKDATYQYMNLKTKDEKLDYIKTILNLEEDTTDDNGDNTATTSTNDNNNNNNNNNSTKQCKKDGDEEEKESILKLLKNPWKIFKQLNFTEEDRYKILLEQFDTLPKKFLDQFYEKIWSLCLSRQHDDNDEDTMTTEKQVNITNARNDIRRTYDIPTKAERHAKKLMPWELMNGELPQLRQMDEEDENYYQFVNLDGLLKPLLSSKEIHNNDVHTNNNIHVERRAVVYHIMKNVKAGEGGLYETALLQNIELRKRLNAAGERINYLEKENEVIFRTAEERIEENAEMIDIVLKRNKEKLLEAQEKAEQAKVAALNLTESLKNVKLELEKTKKKLNKSIEQREKHVKDLRLAKKENDKMTFELKTKYYETNAQPSLWELTSTKKQSNK